MPLLRATAACLALSLLAGCQSMILQQAPLSESVAETVEVQIRPSHGKTKQLKLALEPQMRLMDVVKQSKPRFRNRRAYILRTSPTTGQTHRLEASFGANRKVSLETDYALQPGDRVVIAQDDRTSIERVMLDFLGRS